MIPIYLCEDDEIQLKEWIKFIKNTIIISEWDMNINIATTSPKILLDNINKQKPETAIYFLDIDLKSEINGIELAVEIRKYDPRAFIIFITTHEEMAYATFKYKAEPLGYIIKGADDFYEQIRECLFDAYAKYQVPNNSLTDNLTIQMERRVIMLQLNEVYFIEPSILSHKIRLHKAHEILEFTSSLSEISQKLDDRFMQCHKAYIINCNHVLRVDKNKYTVYFDNGSSCPCSVRQCGPLCKKLADLSIL